MKICFLIPELNYAGAPKMLAWIVNQMKLKKYEVEIVAFFSDIVEQPLVDGVKFHYLGIKQSKKRFVRNTFGMLKTLKALHSYIKKSNPDIVVSFLDSVGYVYLFTNKIFSKRKVIVSERVDPYQHKGLTAKIRHKTMEYANGCVFQTEKARDYFNNKIKNKSVVIPNPAIINFNNEYKVCDFSQRDNRIVTVGRLSVKQKRQDILLQAFKIVHNARPEMKLEIFGGGPDLERINNLIIEMELTDCVKLMGVTKNVQKDIYNAKLFAFTSDYEGIPNSLIEAMSYGVPSVATDCSPGGAALLVKDGENGFLTNCGDVETLSKKMIELIENEKISNRFSKNSPLIIDTLSEYVIANKWEEFFNFINSENK